MLRLACRGRGCRRVIVPLSPCEDVARVGMPTTTAPGVSQKEIFIMPQNHQKLTRRNVLAKMGIGAAAAGGAAALIGSQSAMAAGADSGPVINIIHTHMPGLTKYSRAGILEQLNAAEEPLRASLTAEQHREYIRLSDLNGELHDNEMDDFVEELARPSRPGRQRFVASPGTSASAT
jgi:hypothetical protein